MIKEIFAWSAKKLNGLNVISNEDDLILERRFIINKPNFGIYLHRCLHPDLDPNLFHDHPWSWSFSIILSGEKTWFWRGR